MIFWRQIQLESANICSYNFQGSAQSGRCRELISMVYLLLYGFIKAVDIGRSFVCESCIKLRLAGQYFSNCRL